MAELLYRLGRFSARRAWTVIVSWLIILGLAIGSFLAFGGTLSTMFSIPGTETTKVTDHLEEELPSVAGAAGTVVFHTDDESEFTDEQKSEIGSILEEVEDMERVDSTTDPFATQDELADQSQEISDGHSEIDDAFTELDAAQDQLDEASDQLDEAQEQLDTARAQTTEPEALSTLR